MPAAWENAHNAKSLHFTFELSGESLKRLPAGFEKVDPMVEDRKRKGFIGVCKFDENEITEPKFLQEVRKNFKAATLLMRFLCYSLKLSFWYCRQFSMNGLKD